MFKRTLLTFALLITFALISTRSFSQEVLITGKLVDTMNHVSYLRKTWSVVLNDTLHKSYPRYRFVKNKRKPERLSRAKMIKRNQQDSTSWAHLINLQNDKRYVVNPEQDGKFAIRAKQSDSLIFSSNYFYTQRYSVKDLMKMDSVVIQFKPIPCKPIFRCDDGVGKLHIFIAEKISAKNVSNIYCDGRGGYTHHMDSEYDNNYRIVKNIYGGYDKDTINFTAFDHEGTPEYLKYKYVLLFVSEHCGKFYHEKYQFFDVYPTEDGRWASPGDPYRHDKIREKVFQAQPIAFKGNLFFDISNEYQHVIKTAYPTPYFKLTRKKAIPLTGLYLDDLISIKKEGVLKVRGFNFDL